MRDTPFVLSVPRRGPLAHLGRGLLRPFRRDEKNDFANAEGEELVRACVGQVLSMKATSPKAVGELEWDPKRGSLLYMLVHRNNDMVQRELARVYVVDTIRAFEPRIAIRAMRITSEPREEGGSALIIRLRYDLLAANSSTNQVVREGIVQTVELR